ncbi:MAG: Lrp/AsnC family transcriptional regulator [Rhizobiaceae bacterium]
MYDSFDRKILDILQSDADLPVAEIAERVGLSQTPCWRRIRKMEADGLIRKRVVLLDQKKANVPLTVFISVKAPRHSSDWLNSFRKIIFDMGEVLEAYRLTGEVDYMLRIAVPDIESYDVLYKRMIEKLEFSNLVSAIAMEELKFTTAIPTNYLP